MKEELIVVLNENKDEKYQKFVSSLIPNIDINKIIGVRTPVLRTIVKDILKEKKEDVFLNSLPHQYYEEYQIHSLLLSSKMEYNKLIKYINDFLPFIDNWATCDTLIPKISKSDLGKFHEEILVWLNSGREYSVRFGVYMLMKNYFKEPNIDKYLKLIASIKSDKYYVNMMISWALAEALIIDYNNTIKYLEDGLLERFVHNKTIQKAIESKKIPTQIKEYLKLLRK